MTPKHIAIIMDPPSFRLASRTTDGRDYDFGGLRG